MGTAFDVLAPDREHAHIERVVRVFNVTTPEEAMEFAAERGWRPKGWKRADGNVEAHATLRRVVASQPKPADQGKQLISEMNADTLVRCVAIGVFRAQFWWFLIAIGLGVVIAIITGAGS